MSRRGRGMGEREDRIIDMIQENVGLKAEVARLQVQIADAEIAISRHDGQPYWDKYNALANKEGE
jgi:hypothetical protein